MSNYLIGKKVYLSGPIEFGSTFNWRIKPIHKLTEKFGLDVFDPFSDPKQQWKPALEKARKNKDHSKITKIAKKFVRKDLSQVDKSDMLIAYLPFRVPTTGTHHEIIHSNNIKRPTLLVTNMNDITYIPIWYFGFIRVEFMFPNWKSLYKYLKSVNKGKHRENDRWGLVYGDI